LHENASPGSKVIGEGKVSRYDTIITVLLATFGSMLQMWPIDKQNFMKQAFLQN
jgi:hypothetical protein